MARSSSSSQTTSSKGAGRLRVHGWLWTIVGSLMLLGLLWVRPNDVTAPTLAVLALGAL
jgi:hypothetical protein